MGSRRDTSRAPVVVVVWYYGDGGGTVVEVLVAGSVAWNSRRTCFAGQICQRLAEVLIRPCKLGLICSRGPGAQPPGAPANLRKLAVRSSEIR
jgi:hypothetical protein